jgi:hypothetical protein
MEQSTRYFRLATCGIGIAVAMLVSSAQAQQIPAPQTASQVPGPASGTAMTKADAQNGRLPPLPDKLPASLEARVGKVDLDQGLPTSEGIRQILDIQDFQRASQIYQWAIPAIGVMGWQKASLAAGANTDTDWTIFNDYVPRTGILTPNIEVAYVMMFADLEKTGPLVLAYPEGKIVGILMDVWQRPLFDYGLTGPEKGEAAGKLLIVGPGQETPKDTDGFHVVQSSTRLAWGGFRVLNLAETQQLAGEARLYPYSQREKSPASRVINATKAYTQSPRAAWSTGKTSTNSSRASRCRSATASSRPCCVRSASRRASRSNPMPV